MRGIKLNAGQASRALRQLCDQFPHMRDTIEKVTRDNSGVVRVRSGVFTSTVGYAIGAGGTIGVLSQPLFSRAIGDNDPVLGVLNENQTTVLTGGKVESSKVFIANRFSVKSWFSTLAQAGANGAEEQGRMLNEFNRRCALKLSLGGSDIQRMGSVDEWVAGGSSNRTVVSDSIANAIDQTSADGVYGAVNYEVAEPWVFGDNVTVRMDASTQQVTAAANMNGSIISLRAVFRGLDLDVVQG